MTAATTDGLARSGPAIRAALAEHAPDQLESYEAEFRAALAGASRSFDTDDIEKVLSRWWPLAAARSVRLTEPEADQVRRAASGDLSGLHELVEDGQFRRLG